MVHGRAFGAQGYTVSAAEDAQRPKSEIGRTLTMDLSDISQGNDFSRALSASSLVASEAGSGSSASSSTASSLLKLQVPGMTNKAKSLLRLAEKKR